MAQRQYDITQGQPKESLTEGSGSSISTSAVRVTLDDSNCPSKFEAARCLDVIKQRILEDNWPPSGAI